MAAQVDAWEAAGVSVTKGAMEGYQACVMCYGQTGAGKSHTLANNKPGSEGIMVQAFNYIFDTAANERSLKYEIGLAYVQVRHGRPHECWPTLVGGGGRVNRKPESPGTHARPVLRRAHLTSPHGVRSISTRSPTF